MSTRENADGTLTFGDRPEAPSGYRKPPAIRVALVYHIWRVHKFREFFVDTPVANGMHTVEVRNLEELAIGLKSYYMNAGADSLGLYRHAGMLARGDDGYGHEHWNKMVVTQVILNP